ncbi:MAG: hypothetical protein AAGN35_10375 [Bacteroidota bacterium]
MNQQGYSLGDHIFRKGFSSPFCIDGQNWQYCIVTSCWEKYTRTGDEFPVEIHPKKGLTFVQLAGFSIEKQNSLGQFQSDWGNFPRKHLLQKKLALEFRFCVFAGAGINR